MVAVIPREIGNLRYLQYIGLTNCTNLSSLPGSIVKLHKLRALHLMGTNESGVPKGLGRLENLVELTGFLTHLDSAAGWSSLEELGNLSQLSLLYLTNLENACAGSVVKKAKLHDKLHLRYLSLGCTARIGAGDQVAEDITDEEKQQIEDVFDELRPPPRLENLSLVGFFGRRLPTWMSSGRMTLHSLRALKLEDCVYCEKLPALGHLPSLDFLLIKRAPSIMNIGHEFLCTQTNHQTTMFPRLEKLGFDGLDGWEEWTWDKELQKAMPSLWSLKIMKCKLRSLPPGLVNQTRTLKELIVSETRNLTAIVNFAFLSELHVHASPRLERLANLPRLRKLVVIQCHKLNVLEGLPSLQSIVLQDYNADALPQYLGETNTDKLEVFCNVELLKLVSLQEGSEWCKIEHIQQVKAYAPEEDEGRKWYLFYTKEPFSLTTNIHPYGGLTSTQEAFGSRDFDSYLH